MIRKSQLKLVPADSTILHKPPKEFVFDGELDPKMLSNIMHERMKELGGVGLSANQVGLDLKMFVLGSGDIMMSVFNPELVEVSKEEVSLDEGCLSFPGVYMKVNRPVTCRVKFLNIDGEVVEQTLSGLTCRIFLHEYDHMLGSTFKNRVSALKWGIAVKKKKNKNKKLAKKLTQDLIKQIKEDTYNGNNP